MRGDGLITQYYQIYVIYMIIFDFKSYCLFRFIMSIYIVILQLRINFFKDSQELVIKTDDFT